MSSGVVGDISSSQRRRDTPSLTLVDGFGRSTTIFLCEHVVGITISSQQQPTHTHTHTRFSAVEKNNSESWDILSEETLRDFCQMGDIVGFWRENRIYGLERRGKKGFGTILFLAKHSLFLKFGA